MYLTYFKFDLIETIIRVEFEDLPRPVRLKYAGYFKLAFGQFPVNIFCKRLKAYFPQATRYVS